MANISKLKSLARSMPFPVQSVLRWGVNKPGRTKEAIHLAQVRNRMLAAGRSGRPARVAEFEMRINRGTTPFELYEDIFLNDVYGFEAQRPDPRIIDCGANIGMSVLYFKHRYPQARVVAFEPDPTIVTFLDENIARNRLTGIEVVNAALAAEPGTMKLNSDGEVSSHLAAYKPDDGVWQTFEVPCVLLSDYLDEPVDFLKMNIEGAEHEVLEECEPRIHQIRELNIEYHRLPGVPCTLHKILDLLDRNGFVYTVSDFGLAMYGRARPPVRLDPQARFWRQISASRVSDAITGS